jgi:GNAT superfamily N-acetyltransferase
MIIVNAAGEQMLAMVRTLMLEYAHEWPGGEIETAAFENELDQLPGAYGPPRGALLLALTETNAPSGCVAIKEESTHACEIKRMYLRPALRGSGGGRCLLRAALGEAVRLGYKQVRLDTLQQMTSARRLYESFGFKLIPAYHSTDDAQLVFYGLTLDSQ